MTIIRCSRLSGLFLALGILLPSSLGAQSVPSDLADMNILELRQLDVRSRALPVNPDRFHFAYRRVSSVFEGYRDGTRTVDDSTLIGPPNGTTYPILQDRIVQVVHSFEGSYDVTRKLSVHLAVPYVYQRTDHHGIAGGPAFSEFFIESEGIGDVTLLGSYVAWENESHSVTVSPGLSFPTGSITEKGDTPLPGAENQLPYTMQLGSGTWDIVLSAGYQGNAATPGGTGIRWGAQAVGKIRTGENSQGYRLGHRLLTSTWLGASPAAWIEPMVSLESQVWGKIDGNDAEFFPGPIFPTPVANPDNFGGNRLRLMGRLTLRAPQLPDGAFYDFLSRQAFLVEYGRPVYQSLNGPQPEEECRLTLSWSIDF